jgi:hypothetical protein
VSDTAFKTQYRDEYVAAFEARETLVRKTVTTEADVRGNTAVFLVAGSGGATAVTRGVNGLIPARADDNTQHSCALQEWHDLVRKTRFNVFASQGNQRQLMQETTMAVVNRKIDSDIIGQLEQGTQDTGAATTMSLDLAVYAKTILGNNSVPADGNLFALITPAAEAYLMQTKEFGSANYTSRMPFDGKGGVFTSFMWAGVTWIVHPNLTGKGTAAEKCLMYHRDAIGHAIDMETLQTPIGYDEEQDYSWARASGFFGSKLLQNIGVVVINHDGSAYAAQ